MGLLGVVTNTIAVTLFLAVAGIWWDGWWHVSIGRDSAWVPPHLLIYANVIALFFGSAYLYYRTHERVFLTVLLGTICFALMAPFDALWHAIFGVEDLTTPLAIWSPAHVLPILINLSIALLLLEHWIRRHTESDRHNYLRIVLTSATCFAIIQFLLVPLQPFGWHFVLGIWGVLITISVSTFYILYIGYRLPQRGILLFTVLSLLLFIGFKGTVAAPGILLPAHAQPPLWLNFMALAPLAIMLEFVDIRRYSPALLGGVVGCVLYFVYWIFWQFIDTPDGFLTQRGAFLLVLLSTVAGTAAGVLYGELRRRLGGS